MIRLLVSLFLLFFFSFSLYASSSGLHADGSRASAKPIEIEMWHALAGDLGDEVNQLVKDFNRSQENYLIKPIYKGEYIELLASFAAAFRAKQPPAIVQIFEVGRAAMLHPPGIIKPVDELMQEQGFTLAKERFLPAIRAFYSEADHLVAMPFNTSIPVLFYNADALAKVGYDENSVPRNWDELAILATKLRQVGYRCAYTSAYPSWIHLESFSALHGLAMIEKQPIHAVYNNKALIAHLERLRDWQKKHFFTYGGRENDATILFTSGECALFSQSSGSYKGLQKLVKFRVGVASLPLEARVSSVRHNNVVGGAALWVVAGQNQAIYQGIAQFFGYIAQPQIQQQWHQKTGYLPLASSDGDFPNQRKSSLTPLLQLAQRELSYPYHQHLQFAGPQNQIRAINDEALEAVFAGIKTPEHALNEAVARADRVLRRFARNTRTR